jgi:hypothetical protein
MPSRRYLEQVVDPEGELVPSLSLLVQNGWLIFNRVEEYETASSF